MITTDELIKIIIENHPKIVECQLILTGAFATHFTSAIDKNRLIDEGIDGEKNRINKKDFLSKYRHANWLINQVV